jgi:adenosylhomocysteine nucleosidase
MGVLIAAPMAEELAALRRAVDAERVEGALAGDLPWLGTADHDGRPLLLAVTGDGAGRAGAALAGLLDRWDRFPLGCGLTIGVAGGLDPTLAVGEAVAAREIHGPAGDVLPAAPELLAAARDAAPVRPGLALTSERLLLTPEAKAAAWAALGRPEGAVVDMESAAHAAAARRHDLPWLALRAVSDGAGESLPSLLGDCVRGDGSVDRGRVARKAAFSPTAWGSLLRMKRRVDGASEVLAAVVLGLLRRLAPVLVGLLLLTAGTACSGYRSTPYPPPAAGALEAPAAEPRWLFFALDAVPFRVMAGWTDPALGDDALFRGFAGPVPVISSFPSTSSVAFTGLLEPFGMPPAVGYEAVSFNRETNEVEGYGFKSYKELPYSWRDFFTWRYGKPFSRAVATATPVRSSLKEVRWVLERFLASDEPVFHGYVAMTDGAAHLEGPEGLRRTMEVLDHEIRRLRRERPDMPFHAVIYSDHGIDGAMGGPPLVNVRKPVSEALEAAGFRRRKTLEEPRDVVLVPFGLVSSFEIYGHPGDGPELARVAATVPGVDLCTAPLGEEPDAGWLVVGSEGEARFSREERGGVAGWVYGPVEGPDGGDPLGYLELSNGGWLSDAAWLDWTATHRYPDALHRIARAFDLVEHPASVVCSVDDGHMYGAWTGEWSARLTVGRLRWTHGALTAGATLGFLLTDAPGWEPPAALRFDEALEDFAGKYRSP